MWVLENANLSNKEKKTLYFSDEEFEKLTSDLAKYVSDSNKSKPSFESTQSVFLGAKEGSFASDFYIHILRMQDEVFQHARKRKVNWWEPGPTNPYYNAPNGGMQIGGINKLEI